MHAEKNFFELISVLLDTHENLVKSNKFLLIEINVLDESTKYSDLVKATKYFLGSTKHFVARIINKFCV